MRTLWSWLLAPAANFQARRIYCIVVPAFLLLLANLPLVLPAKAARPYSLAFFSASFGIVVCLWFVDLRRRRYGRHG